MHDINIGKLNGRYVAYWKEGGVRRRFRLKAKSKAEAKAEALTVYASREALDPTNLTVENVWNRYHTYLGDRRTAHQMDSAWKDIGPFFGKLHPLKITDELVDEYMKDRRARFKKRWGREMSNGTLHSEINMLNCALNYGYKRDLLPRQFFLPKPQKPAPRDRWLNEKEVISLLRAAEVTPHAHVAIALMLATAGRITAVLELTWDRVDFENRWIDLRIDPKKPAKGRALVPMNDGLCDLLKNWKLLSETETVVGYRGKSIASLNTSFYTIAESAGLKDVSPHVLRHTAAVHMVASGCEMERVSQYLGHSSVAVTRRVYARFAPEHLRKEAQAVDFLRRIGR